MADGSFPGLVSKDRNVNSLTNEIFVGVTDGVEQLEITAAGEISVDAITTSVTPGTAAANLGKAVDSAAGATDTGVAALVVRDDVLTTLTPVDGDYVNLRVNSTGALHVTSTSLNNDAIIVDDTAFTPATSSVSASGFFADETATDSVDEGDIGAARMTLDRKQLVRVVGSTDANRLEIDANGDIDIANINTSVTPGTAAANLGKAVDSVAGGTDTGVAALVVRDDVLTTLTPADGDYTTLRVSSTGELHVTSSSLNNDAIIVDDTAFTPATSSVSASGFFADEVSPDSVDEGDIGAARMTLDRKQLNVIVDATTDSQRLVINSSGEIGVVQATHDDLNLNANIQVANVDVSTTVPVPVSATTAQNTELNPIFTHNVATVISGEEVHDFQTTASLASDTSTNHDFTAVGTFTGTGISWAGSGSVKCVVIVDATGTPVTKFTGFLTGRQGDTKFQPFIPAIEATAGEIVRVTLTNRQGAAADVYSTLMGSDF